MSVIILERECSGVILVIAEKPVLAKDIAGALPGEGVVKDGCYYKGEYIVTHLFGHMLGLKEPEDYDQEYKEWKVEQLPIYFDDWQHKMSKDGGKVAKMKQIGGLLKSADMVIHAGDPDDEGQLLVDEVLRWFHYRGIVKRLDTGNTTRDALVRALRCMKDNKQFENEGWAAYARAVADLTVGVNMSRYFTLKNGVMLTVGRVQSPTLGMVVNRDLLIEGHHKVLYYELFADLGVKGEEITTKFHWCKGNPVLSEDGKCLDREALLPKEAMLREKTFSNVVVSKSVSKEKPPLPFNLVKLQTYCGNHFNLSPEAVLKITQNLREKYKAITYNRSDCQYLSEEHFMEAPEVLDAVSTNLGYERSHFDETIKSKCFNSSKITAHFAIIPTSTRVDLNAMQEVERKVYTAIAHYYLAQFLPPAEKEKTELVVDLGNGEKLQATSIKVLKPGYLTLLKGEKKEECGVLSELKEGIYDGSVLGTTIEKKETKPPARYTLHSLNEDMTRIAKYVDDPEIKALLIAKDEGKEGENGSIGTPATRSTIIDHLLKRGFLELKGKSVISTPLGRELYRILPDEIKKADMTAKWWVIQEDIKAGKCGYQALTENVLQTVTKIIQTEYPKVNKQLLVSASQIASVGKCPICGKDMIEGKTYYRCAGHTKENATCDFIFWKQQRFFEEKTGKAITKTQVKKLLKNGAVEVVCKKKDGSGTYPAVFKLGREEKDGRVYYGLTMGFIDYDDPERDSIGVCPVCGAEMKEREKFYICSHYTKENATCDFVLWKEQRFFKEKTGRTITKSQIKTILKKGSVQVMCKKNDGTGTYPALFRLASIMKDEKRYYGLRMELLSFDEMEKEVIGKCPKCGGNVVVTTKGYFCENEECRFALWPEMKHFSNVLKITKSKAKALLSRQGQAPFKLKSKTGKEYEAYLAIKLNGNYVNFEQVGFVKKR